MPIEFTPLKTNGVYSKIFTNEEARMVIKINTTPFAHMEEEADVYFIDKISIREAAVLQKIGFHPNIITPKFISLRKVPTSKAVFLPDEEESLPHPSQSCLAIGMERGIVLRRKKKGSPVPTNEEIATFLHHIACGLAHAHANDIAHRDVKPDNIIKISAGFYQLIDWGLAGLAPSEKQSDSKQYVTRWYRSPELLDQEVGPADHRAADIWALAISTLEIFFNPAQLFAKNVHTQLVMATYLSKQTPPQLQNFFRDSGAESRKDLADLLSKMLTRNPSSRITAEKMLSHPYISQYSAYAPSPKRCGAEARPPGRHRLRRNLEEAGGDSGQHLFSVREKMYEWMCGVWAYYPHIRTISLFTAYEICDRYLHSPEGRASLEGRALPEGRASLDTPEGRALPDTPEGRASLDTPEGRASLDTPEGRRPIAGTHLYLKTFLSPSKARPASGGYQMVGCAALSIADALYDTWSLSHKEIAAAAGDFFTTDDLEQTILNISRELDWDLYTPGIYLKWKTQVQNSEDFNSIISLAVLVADQNWSHQKILESVASGVVNHPIPKRFTLFRQLVKKKNPPAPLPLILI